MTIIVVIMVRRQPYSLVYARAGKENLRAIEAKFYSLIRDTIEEQLSFEPEVESRNRKPMRRPVEFGATWELRFGPGNRFRVFYDTDQERHEVHVLAIGTKDRDRLIIGGEEFEI